MERRRGVILVIAGDGAERRGGGGVESGAVGVGGAVS